MSEITAAKAEQIRRAPNASRLLPLLPDGYNLIHRRSTRSWALTWRGQVLVSEASFEEVKQQAARAVS